MSTAEPVPAVPGTSHGQLCYLQIPAIDVTTSAQFYEAVFGWHPDPPDSGFEAPGMIGQWITDRPPSPDAGPVGWLWVDDIAVTLARATAHGGRVRDVPFSDADGRRLATILDPAGSIIGIVHAG